jgi:tellurite resistance protein TerC
MYFAVSRLMKVFRFLHYGLAAMLVLVGSKMLMVDYFRIPTSATLGIVAAVLLISIAVSAIFPAPKLKGE